MSRPTEDMFRSPLDFLERPLMMWTILQIYKHPDQRVTAYMTAGGRNSVVNRRISELRDAGYVVAEQQALYNAKTLSLTDDGMVIARAIDRLLRQYRRVKGGHDEQ